MITFIFKVVLLMFFVLAELESKKTWSKFDKAAHRSLQGKSLLNMCRGELSAVIKKLCETYL